MAKIDRYNGNVVAFGSEAEGTERTVFGDTTQSDSLDQNLNSFYKRGFGIVNVNEAPTKQDFNAVNFTNSQLIAYLHQAGIAEWNTNQEYHSGSLANVNGIVYKSKTDNNVGNDPTTDTTNWTTSEPNQIQLLSTYDNGTRTDAEILTIATSAMNTLGKSLIIDQPVDLGGATVDCLGVDLVWLSEGNVISNGTLHNIGFLVASNLYIFDAGTLSFTLNNPQILNNYSFNLTETSTGAEWQAVFNKLKDNVSEFEIFLSDVTSIDTAVDCFGTKLKCHNTVIPSSTRTFVNHGGIENGVIAGVNTSVLQLNPSFMSTCNKNKIFVRVGDRDYDIYMAKKDPQHGYLKVESRADITASTNSLGGNSASRITNVKNINNILAYKHTFSSANHTPVDTVTRSLSTGAAPRADIAFWDIPSNGGLIRFDTGSIIEEVSILFLLSPGSSDNVTIRWDGNDIDTVSLKSVTGGREYYTYRKKVVPGNSQITLINNSTTEMAYIAGINAYKPGEEFPVELALDTIAFSSNTQDYMDASSAVDYALRRHPDDYAGDDPTGGSYHGGETIISEGVYVRDNTSNWFFTSSVGDMTASKTIRLVTNVNIEWPDGKSVNAVKINSILDGGIYKHIRLVSDNQTFFDCVWTTMWATPKELTSVRGVTAKEISGVSSEFRCFERTNSVQQDLSTVFGILNSFTVFENEKNSCGGVYVAKETGTRAKLYYGPILFNKGTFKEIHSEQHTEFFGSDL